MNGNGDGDSGETSEKTAAKEWNVRNNV